jgi:AraC-like DNA-binding protein
MPGLHQPIPAPLPDHRALHHQGPAVAARALTVHHAGALYPMSPQEVHRPRGTDNHLVMVFHDSCMVADHREHVERGPCWIWWRPGQPHRYGHLRQPWLHSWMHLGGNLVTTALAGVPAHTCMPLPEPGWGLPLLLAAAWRVRHERDPVLVANAVEDWLRVLARTATPQRPIPAAIRQAHERIEAGWDGPLRIADVARRVGLSSSALVNGFRRWYGTTPTELLAQLRCDRALLLLREPALSVAAVAAAVGYDDPFHFSRVLRRRSGRSPTGWRRHWGISQA